MSYADELRKHARIAILRFLEDAPKYTSNVSMLATQLPRVGIAFTRDQVTTEAHWLAEQGLVEVEDHAGFLVVVATTRGVEIAQGIARHPDIQRPRPGA
ncbi:hypothetical protein [Tritonibacter mobilis]|uniref:ArsR family transcriptional regulator n=1 Tax=Tritonibacter mobilis F1926 TaxID=1265309 RepID=A0A1B1A000_9RHOB|nr:hypothetical protein [Tritonibacter mobilis]ANP39910.1 hypothetical protein K529_003950 [Tritonibacter mobilis F1926]EEW60162.1 conserved hypothetical protein [Ruegeria sp. TrichCH4B]KJZ21838.1 hypothetical protein TW79_20865 [Tritonibacter mobilis]